MEASCGSRSLMGDCQLLMDAFVSVYREDIFVFLLSTRAGGLGINLTAADTVSRGLDLTGGCGDGQRCTGDLWGKWSSRVPFLCGTSCLYVIFSHWHIPRWKMDIMRTFIIPYSTFTVFKATEVVLCLFIRVWFIYWHRAVVGKCQGMSLPVNCRIIFNWIPGCGSR